jgi:hypothetical protein
VLRCERQSQEHSAGLSRDSTACRARRKSPKRVALGNIDRLLIVAFRELVGGDLIYGDTTIRNANSYPVQTSLLRSTSSGDGAIRSVEMQRVFDRGRTRVRAIHFACRFGNASILGRPFQCLLIGR